MKTIIRTNVLALIEKQQGPLGPRESSGVSRLMRLGISNGNAQRILDDTSDVYLGSLLQLANALKVKVWELLTPGLQSSSMPFRNLDAFEAQLMSLFRQLSEYQQRELLVDLSEAVKAGSSPPPPAAPPSQSHGARHRLHVLGHVPDRHGPTQVDDGQTPSMPTKPKRDTK